MNLESHTLASQKNTGVCIPSSSLHAAGTAKVITCQELSCDVIFNSTEICFIIEERSNNKHSPFAVFVLPWLWLCRYTQLLREHIQDMLHTRHQSQRRFYLFLQMKTLLLIAYISCTRSVTILYSAVLQSSFSDN